MIRTFKFLPPGVKVDILLGKMTKISIFAAMGMEVSNRMSRYIQGEKKAERQKRKH